jgi:hypothetical protein
MTNPKTVLVPAGDLGPEHIGARVRIEFEAITVEASIDQVSHHYRATGHNVYVTFYRGPEDGHYGNRVLTSLPSLALGPTDRVALLRATPRPA